MANEIYVIPYVRRITPLDGGVNCLDYAIFNILRAFAPGLGSVEGATLTEKPGLLGGCRSVDQGGVACGALLPASDLIRAVGLAVKWGSGM
jgi:hypothetical protein